MPLRQTELIIDLKQLEKNIQLLRSWSPNAFFCPMLKANAYGHGIQLVLPILQNNKIQCAGVVLIEEGIQLRELGFTGQVLVFGYFPPESAEVLVAHRLTPVVSSYEDLKNIQSVAGKLFIHIKFDTGMHRLGFDWQKSEELNQSLQRAGFQVEGVCTHLSQGYDILESSGRSLQQIERFHHAKRFWPQAITHVLNSEALEKAYSANVKEVLNLGSRPGLAMYGLTGHSQLKPVSRLETQLIAVKEVGRGEGVSYGSTWRAPANSRVGVIPLGYGDGYRRALSNRSSMIWRNHRVPVVGTICMDYTFLDLTDFCAEGMPQVGERVIVLGDDITAIQLAEELGTIPYEIMTGWTARVPRRGT